MAGTAGDLADAGPDGGGDDVRGGRSTDFQLTIHSVGAGLPANAAVDATSHSRVNPLPRVHIDNDPTARRSAAPTALEPLFPIVVAWLCARPGAMIQPLRRKEYKLADAHRAARDRPCANREQT
ncbi:hypothetical protein EI693_05045 [Pseudomonas oryziphila]|uniref:Uncharacterized protein n=1 Tax=Pseudomonas oryziphila TaxID=2894079 RepID=A0ABM7CM62_9PSED|nr:hypothetical protein EI693_05045 [Pseudomonas oryziphila]